MARERALCTCGAGKHGQLLKPIFNVLENSLTVVLANAEDVKGRKGHKTDPKDS